MPKFIRRIWKRYSKLGRGRKKKQIWRRPTGRDNKMREKLRGYPAVVSVGYRGEKNLRGLIEDKEPKLIMSVKDLEKIKENEIALVGKVGKKKKIEIANKAKELKIKLHNMNPEKFLKENGKKKIKVPSKKVESGQKKPEVKNEPEK